MKKKGQICLIPCYGRKYKSKAAVKVSLQEMKDFTVQNTAEQWNGKPANLRDIRLVGYQTILVRYAKLERVAVFDTEELL